MGNASALSSPASEREPHGRAGLRKGSKEQQGARQAHAALCGGGGGGFTAAVCAREARCRSIVQGGTSAPVPAAVHQPHRPTHPTTSRPQLARSEITPLVGCRLGGQRAAIAGCAAVCHTARGDQQLQQTLALQLHCPPASPGVAGGSRKPRAGPQPQVNHMSPTSDLVSPPTRDVALGGARRRLEVAHGHSKAASRHCRRWRSSCRRGSRGRDRRAVRHGKRVARDGNGVGVGARQKQLETPRPPRVALLRLTGWCECGLGACRSISEPELPGVGTVCPPQPRPHPLTTTHHTKQTPHNSLPQPTLPSWRAPALWSWM